MESQQHDKELTKFSKNYAESRGTRDCWSESGSKKDSALVWRTLGLFDAFVTITHPPQAELVESGHFPFLFQKYSRRLNRRGIPVSAVLLPIYNILKNRARTNKSRNLGGFLPCRCHLVGTGKAAVCETRNSPVKTAVDCNPAPPEEITKAIEIRYSGNLETVKLVGYFHQRHNLKCNKRK